MSIRLNKNVVNKTASFTMDANAFPSGTRFTNRGAGGAVTVTLPTLTSAKPWVGYTVELYGCADQNFGFAVAAGKGVAINSLTAVSLTLQTGGQKIGGLLEAVWDGTQWNLSAQQGTGTVA